MRLISFLPAKLSLFPLRDLQFWCAFVVAVFCMFARPIAAQENTPLFDNFPFLKKTATQLSSDRVESSVTDFALSSIKKVNGRWRVDEVKSLAGRLQKNTFELSDLTAAEAAEHIKKDAVRLNWVVQFQCAGLACGTSYAWANQVFNNKLLDGVDALQHYWVWKTPAGWARIYIVERGNKRVYLHWQLLIENNEIVDSKAALWQQQGFAELEFSNVDTLTREQIMPLLQWLKSLGAVGFAVVGHSEAHGELSQLEAISLRDATEVASRLQTFLPELVIKTYGLGPLAPRKGKGARIEIVPILP